MRLESKIALITGAGSGIGRAMAMVFAAEGARVFLVDIDGETAAETAEMVRQAGGESDCYVADVSESDAVQGMIASCIDRFGGIDILCNNAGVGSTQNVVDTPEDLWERVMAVNARGTFLGCKYAIPRMVTSGGRVIVNTASVAGLIGLKNRAAYCAAKGAVVSLTRQIAVDYVRQGIRCNCICPATVDTPWVARNVAAAPDPEAEWKAMVARQPIGRLGTADEVARAALYLASEDAAFITGSALVIDGGMTAQ